MTVSRPIWLASSSPRRRRLLAEAGIEVTVLPPEHDDARLEPRRVGPAAWVMAMAHLKARSVADRLRDRERIAGGTVLGADTVCTREGRILGQARDADHARRMLRDLRGAEHHTLTGVCLLDLATGARRLFFEVARVRVGELSDAVIDAYVRSGQWRGKAGAYNLADRVRAGWPISCVGEAATVMGLPMDRLRRLLSMPGAVGA